MSRTLELIGTSFPGRAAFDSAVSRALLREVASGARGETLRLYRPDDVVAFSTTDLRRPGFERAVGAARARGFDAALRLAGGSAAVFSTETLAFAWCTPDPEGRAGIHARFERTAQWVVRALRGLGVDARMGEVPGAYCPGDFSVNAGGRRKLMGVGQRIVRGAVHVGGVVVVGGSRRLRAVLEPVYEALELDYEPASTGAVGEEGVAADLDSVREALLAEVRREHELRDGVLGPATLAQAAVFEPSHRIGA